MYKRYFEIKDEATLIEIAASIAIRKDYMAKLNSIKDEVGASNFFVTRSSLC